MGWSIDNLARAFRELYSNLNWLKVFEALTEIPEGADSHEMLLDQKAFTVFLQIFNKTKPQNLAYPLNIVLNNDWANPALHLNFLENSILIYTQKIDKSINFGKTERRQELLEELASIKDKVPIEHLNVWLSVEVVE